jgi:hypothetical protein
MPKFVLSDETVEAVKAAHTALDTEVTAMEQEHTDASEKWQDSDAGITAGAWLEELRNLVDDLDNVKASPTD